MCQPRASPAGGVAKRRKMKIVLFSFLHIFSSLLLIFTESHIFFKDFAQAAVNIKSRECMERLERLRLQGYKG